MKTRSLHSGHQKKRKEKETYLAKFARQKLITGVKSNQGDIQRKMMPQAQNTVGPFPLHCTSYPRRMHANERNRTIMRQAAWNRCCDAQKKQERGRM